jgi:hypothetical protein
MSGSIQAGDKVRHKGGETELFVVEIYPGGESIVDRSYSYALCSWEKDGQYFEKEFDLHVLESFPASSG